MPFMTYQETKPWANSIWQRARCRNMPPWFADPRFGRFANDPSLNGNEIDTLARWAQAHAPAGDPNKAAPRRHWTGGWNISMPQAIVTMPQAVAIPPAGDVEYTYEIVPTGFREDKWVQMAEVRPTSRDHVHHAVIYIRPPDSNWLRPAPVNVPFTVSQLADDKLREQAHATDNDMLLVYAPGSSPDHWPEGMAKFIPAYSDLVFQMHYTTNQRAARDQTSVGMVFANTPPSERIFTLQLANDHDPIPIPPNTDNYRVEVHGILPNDAKLLSFFPHMHLRGKRFEYNIVHDNGSLETLLRVNYDFYWQLTYRLAEPRLLKAGTKLQAVAWYDNSRRNPHNPNPDSPVYWGDQTYNEMMVGFFDVAVPAGIDKWHFFIRHHQH
ncbi:MAG: thiol-disulfide isomerase [Acidobacteria bacterium]|nr:thiol-disulfide isomerase [Acidobacteriota bacterium]